jgi:hypothetical protein
VIIEEGRFFYPYIEWMKSRTDDHPYALGLEMATGGMAYVNEAAHYVRNHGGRHLLVDITGLDYSIPAWLIRDAFDILFDCFDMSHVHDSEDKTWPVNSDKSTNRFAQIIDYFINTPIRLPNGERFRKSAGIPSGSMFTNLIDTIVNAIILRYSVYQSTGKLPLADIYMGDDSYIGCSGTINLDDISKIALSKFNVTISPEKSYVTERISNIEFLGYQNYNGKPMRDSTFLLGCFIYPERTVRNPIETVTRALGQMYSTLDSAKAYVWFEITRRISNLHQITNHDMQTYMLSKPGRFKYLTQLGYKLTDVCYSQRFANPYRVIHVVEPPPSATRSFNPLRMSIY